MTPEAASGDRLENLLGAWSLRAVTTLDRALADASGLASADRAALVSLLNWADGENIDTLRRALRLSQPGSSHAVDRLSRLGLVSRRRSSTDGRATTLVLTAAGEQLARALLSARREVMRELLAPLGAEERAALESTLDKLLAAGVVDVETARHDCRLCDTLACGHGGRCPVTRSARGAEPPELVGEPASPP